jgi:hypothetical protein
VGSLQQWQACWQFLSVFNRPVEEIRPPGRAARRVVGRRSSAPRWSGHLHYPTADHHSARECLEFRGAERACAGSGSTVAWSSLSERACPVPTGASRAVALGERRCQADRGRRGCSGRAWACGPRSGSAWEGRAMTDHEPDNDPFVRRSYSRPCPSSGRSTNVPFSA